MKHESVYLLFLPGITLFTSVYLYGWQAMNMQIEDKLIQAYIDRFINPTDSWYRQIEHNYIHFKPEMKDSRYEYVPVTSRLVRAHIAGRVTVAWPLLDANYYGKYLAFDSDLLDGQLDRLQDAWLEHDWHILRTKGRSDRDGHLFICFDKPMEAKYLIRLADVMMKYAGITGLERFPKNAESQSQLRGALGINKKIEAKKARDWFVGPPHDIHEQLQWLIEQPLNSAAEAIELAKNRRPIELPPVLLKRANKSLTGAANKITFETAITMTGAKAGSSGWWYGHCPASGHKNGDRNPSLSIKEADDGGAIVKCWAGCKPKDVYAYMEKC